MIEPGEKSQPTAPNTTAAIGYCNFAAGSAPTADNDETEGYSKNSFWYKATAPVKLWHCTEAAEGAAVWKEIALTSTFTLSEIAGTLAISKGGTGQTTAANAINTLLPSQSGNNGKSLKTNGTVSSWDYLMKIGELVSGSTSNRLLFTSSGNLTESANLTFVSDVLSTPDIKLTNTITRTMTRSLPTTVGNAVNIGNFAFTNGAGILDFWVTVPSSGYSQSKRYSLPIGYNNDTVWKKCYPIASTGAYSSTDFDLEIKQNGVDFDFRLRKTQGTTAGTAYITIIQQGVNSDVFTPSTSSGSATAPTLNYEPKADALFATRIQIGNSIADAGSFSLTNYNASGYPVPAFFKTATHNGGSTPAAAEPALVLGREGVGGVAYGNFAEFKVSRWEHSGATARTALTFSLTHGNGDGTGTDVLTLRSDKAIVLVDGVNLIFGTTNGTVVGQTGSKVGFLGAMAQARQSITGSSGQDQIDSIVSLLVGFGLGNDDR